MHVARSFYRKVAEGLLRQADRLRKSADKIDETAGSMLAEQESEMAFDVNEVGQVIDKVRSELETLLHVEKNRTPIGGFVVATDRLDTIKEVPGNNLMLLPAALKGMINFKTKENAEEIARFWNEKMADRGPGYQNMTVKVMTKKEHLLALIPHHRALLKDFEGVRQSLIEKANDYQ